MAYDNNMTGVLFKNDKKEPGSKQPDYRGKCEIGGKVLEIAAWIREGEKGKFMSLKFQEPRQQEKPAPKRDSAFDDMNSDIPW